MFCSFHLSTKFFSFSAFRCINFALFHTQVLYCSSECNKCSSTGTKGAHIKCHTSNNNNSNRGSKQSRDKQAATTTTTRRTLSPLAKVCFAYYVYSIKYFTVALRGTENSSKNFAKNKKACKIAEKM